MKPLKLLGLITVIVTAFFLLYGVNDMPNWGDSMAPASVHVSPYYIQRSQADTNAPNFVSAVLADYRGFDTLFETTVIFCAGMACLMLLRKEEDDD